MKKRVIGEKKKRIFTKQKVIMYLIGGFLIILMVGGAINMDGEESEAYEYNGVEFTLTNIGWLGYKGDKQIVLTQNPEVAKNVTVNGRGFDTLNDISKIYISINPDDYLSNGLSEFSRNIQLEPVLITACFEDFEGCEDMPIKDCDDSSLGTGVIIFKEGEDNKIDFENNCLVVESKDGEMINVIDRLILEWYNI